MLSISFFRPTAHLYTENNSTSSSSNFSKKTLNSEIELVSQRLIANKHFQGELFIMHVDSILSSDRKNMILLLSDKNDLSYYFSFENTFDIVIREKDILLLNFKKGTVSIKKTSPAQLEGELIEIVKE